LQEEILTDFMIFAEICKKLKLAEIIRENVSLLSQLFKKQINNILLFNYLIIINSLHNYFLINITQYVASIERI